MALDHLDYVLLICTQALRSSLSLVPKSERRAASMELQSLIVHARKRVKLEAQRLKALAGCAPAKLKPLSGIADIANLRPRKKFIGTPAYEGLKQQAAPGAGSPTWNGALQCALFWSRGELSLAEILRRVAHEFGRDTSAGLAAHFRYMARHGLVEWKKKRKPLHVSISSQARKFKRSSKTRIRGYKVNHPQTYRRKKQPKGEWISEVVFGQCI